MRDTGNSGALAVVWRCDDGRVSRVGRARCSRLPSTSDSSRKLLTMVASDSQTRTRGVNWKLCELSFWLSRSMISSSLLLMLPGSLLSSRSGSTMFYQALPFVALLCRLWSWMQVAGLDHCHQRMIIDAQREIDPATFAAAFVQPEDDLRCVEGVTC